MSSSYQTDHEKIDFKVLFDNDNFSKWARQSFADDEFANNLNRYIAVNYRDFLAIDCDSRDRLAEKLTTICDEIITKYEIDEFLLREFNKSGFSAVHLQLNTLEINNKRLDVLEELLERTSGLAKRLGVEEAREDAIVIDDDDEDEIDANGTNGGCVGTGGAVWPGGDDAGAGGEQEVTIGNEDDDEVQIVSLSARQRHGRGQVTKISIDISNSLQYISSKELLNGFQACLLMPVFVKANGDIWLKGVIENITNGDRHISEQRFDVRLENEDLLPDLTGFCLANIKSSLDFCKIYPVGTRVVSVYSDENGCIAHYSGVIAEPPGSRNSYRYLIFFDDGYTQYSTQNEVYCVFQQNLENWKQMNEDSQEFVKSYLESYPERPMVRMKIGQLIRIEYNSEWCPTKVEKVDASLAYVNFQNAHREWIYRGSTRIEALFKEVVLRPRGKGKRSTMNKSNRAVVEYTRTDSKNQLISSTNNNSTKTSARKSTSKQRIEPDTNPYVNFNMSDIDLAGTFITTLDNILKTRSLPAYVTHKCTRACVITPDESDRDNPDYYKCCNPLEIPIHAGWFRVKSVPSGNKTYIGKSSIYYVSPCGHRTRNITELDQYLVQTKCKMNLDMFSFEVDVRVNREFQVLKVITNIPDISYGKENVQIPCVNSVDNDVPQYIDYIPYRHYFDEDLNMQRLEEDPDFLMCCDCTDNCKNKSKCACHQLTAEYARPVNQRHGIGYINKRLYQFHPGGIFECNSRCSCNVQCRNRVVQNGLWNKLQIFKTEKKGWGIRTLHDIPRGAFICIYAGTIFNEETAVDEGRKFGDEYQAELDYIETIQESKEGYESGVEEPDGSESDHFSDDSNDQAKAELLADSDDSESSASIVSSQNKAHNSLAGAKPTVVFAKPHEECQKDSFVNSFSNAKNPLVASVEGNVGNVTAKSSKTGGRRHTSMHLPKVQATEGADSSGVATKKFDIREYLGDPNPFIMDAKRAGNLGRYFNHSCSPNLFVQNVFITSHDLRYPEVAFFAKRNIEAGEEITWDYMYRVGSVPDKVLYCYCGSPDCRGRLL